MKTANLEINWAATDALSAFTTPVTIDRVSHRNSNPDACVRGISSAKQILRCPHCASIIYSRRSKLCGVCAQLLPQELLFSPAETVRIESLLAQERQRHRRWVSKVSACHQ